MDTESTPTSTPTTEDKQVTVAVPADRVPEFYAWFAAFLANERGGSHERRRRHHGGPRRGGPRNRMYFESDAWSAEDADRASWLYGKLAPPARELFDLLSANPGERISGNDLAAKLDLDKGAHGVAGILAWPGRYCRKLARDLPIVTAGREDGGTDYFMEPDVARLFAEAAKQQQD